MFARIHFRILTAGLVLLLPILLFAQFLPDPIFDDRFERGPNRSPVAIAGGSPLATVGVPATFDGSASWDPDGDPISHVWRLLERPPGSGAALFYSNQVAPVLIVDVAGA